MVTVFSVQSTGESLQQYIEEGGGEWTLSHPDSMVPRGGRREMDAERASVRHDPKALPKPKPAAKTTDIGKNGTTTGGQGAGKGKDKVGGHGGDKGKGRQRDGAGGTNTTTMVGGAELTTREPGSLNPWSRQMPRGLDGAMAVQGTRLGPGTGTRPGARTGAGMWGAQGSGSGTGTQTPVGSIPLGSLLDGVPYMPIGDSDTDMTMGMGMGPGLTRNGGLLMEDEEDEEEEWELEGEDDFVLPCDTCEKLVPFSAYERHQKKHMRFQMMGPEDRPRLYEGHLSDGDEADDEDEEGQMMPLRGGGGSGGGIAGGRGLTNPLLDSLNVMDGLGRNADSVGRGRLGGGGLGGLGGLSGRGGMGGGMWGATNDYALVQCDVCGDRMPLKAISRHKVVHAMAGYEAYMEMWAVEAQNAEAEAETEQQAPADSRQDFQPLDLSQGVQVYAGALRGVSAAGCRFVGLNLSQPMDEEEHQPVDWCAAPSQLMGDIAHLFTGACETRHSDPTLDRKTAPYGRHIAEETLVDMCEEYPGQGRAVVAVDGAQHESLFSEWLLLNRMRLSHRLGAGAAECLVVIDEDTHAAAVEAAGGKDDGVALALDADDVAQGHVHDLLLPLFDILNWFECVDVEGGSGRFHAAAGGLEDDEDGDDEVRVHTGAGSDGGVVRVRTTRDVRPLRVLVFGSVQSYVAECQRVARELDSRTASVLQPRVVMAHEGQAFDVRSLLSVLPVHALVAVLGADVLYRELGTGTSGLVQAPLDDDAKQALKEQGDEKITVCLPDARKVHIQVGMDDTVRMLRQKVSLALDDTVKEHQLQLVLNARPLMDSSEIVAELWVELESTRVLYGLLENSSDGVLTTYRNTPGCRTNGMQHDLLLGQRYNVALYTPKRTLETAVLVNRTTYVGTHDRSQRFLLTELERLIERQDHEHMRSLWRTGDQSTSTISDLDDSGLTHVSQLARGGGGAGADTGVGGGTGSSFSLAPSDELLDLLELSAVMRMSLQ